MQRMMLAATKHAATRGPPPPAPPPAGTHCLPPPLPCRAAHRPFSHNRLLSVEVQSVPLSFWPRVTPHNPTVPVPAGQRRWAPSHPPPATMDADAEVHVHSIKILGAERTRVGTIEGELLGVYAATTLAGVFAAVQEAKDAFDAFGIFKTVHVHLAPVDPADNAGPGAAHLVVMVEEVPARKFKAQMSLEGAQISADVTGELLNGLGCAETFTAEGVFGRSGRSNYRVGVRVPHPVAGLRGTVAADAYESTVGLDESCGCAAAAAGVNVRLQPDGSRHSFALALAQRTLVPTFARPGATFANVSPEMLRQAMDPSFKASLQHMYSWTWRIGGGGVAGVKVTNELAGLAGDVCFLKSQAEVTSAHLLSRPYWGAPGLECRTRILGGVLYSMGIDGGRRHPSSVGSHFHDRFFLGGTTGVAPLLGFQDRRVGGEVGARDQRRGQPANFFDAMGGDVVFAASAQLRTPLPTQLLQDLGVKGTMHLSAGNLATLASWPGFRSFFEAARVTAGVGLAVPTPLGEVSVTYSVGLSGATSTDASQRYQVGFGFDF